MSDQAQIDSVLTDASKIGPLSFHRDRQHPFRVEVTHISYQKASTQFDITLVPSFNALVCRWDDGQPYSFPLDENAPPLLYRLALGYLVDILGLCDEVS